MKTMKVIDMADCVVNDRAMPKVRLPWHLRVAGRLQYWYVQNIVRVNPDTQRIVRFYTYNDDYDVDFDFSCPHYAYDYSSCLYDGFLRACDEIGKIIQNTYSIPGNYYYDVKVTLDPENWTGYYYSILKTDNPRCVEGRNLIRKDCSYIRNCESNITICGYHLSGKYKRMKDVLEDLAGKIVVVHSHSDAKALLRILQFLGVYHILMGNHCRYNIPAKYGRVYKNFYGYCLERRNFDTIICRVHKSYHPAVSEVLDIDELIVKRDLKARLRDLWGR